MTINLNKNSKKPIWATLFTLSIVGLLFAFTASFVRADDHILYVDANATAGTNTGGSWANAFTNLQSAFDVAEAGDEIWVADGVYKPTKLADPLDPRTATYELIEGVKLYGGFAGGEASIDDRDWETNLTILSGDLDSNDLNVNTNNGITTKTEYIDGSNAYSLIVGNHAITYTNATVVDGFTITAGQTFGLGGPEAGISDGAALRFKDYASPILRNLHIIGNRSTDDGGGIFFRHFNNPILENVTIENTFAKDFGAGIFFFDDNNPTFKNVSIINTHGEFSGGIYINDRNIVEIVNFYACGNLNEFSSPNAFGNSGTSLSFGSENEIQITNAAFAANFANENGSAIRFRGDNNVNLTNVTITGNQALEVDISVPNPGGAIFTREPGNVFNVANSIIWGNSKDFGWGEGGQPTVNATYSIIGNGAAPEGVGNIAAPSSPFSADPTSGADAEWGTDDDTCGNLLPQITSVAVNAGSNAALPADILDIDDNGDTTETLPLDLIQETRISGSSVDMGAYEVFIPPLSQTIAFTTPENNSEVPYDGTVNLVATASSGLPVSFTSLTPAVCTVDGTELTVIDFGTCSVSASQLGNSQYGPALSVTHNFTVGKRVQTITFPAPAGLADAEAGDTFALMATADSELPVTYTSNSPAVCSVTGNTLEILDTGICRIEATQDGDSEWNAAPSKVLTVFVGQPTIRTFLPVVNK